MSIITIELPNTGSYSIDELKSILASYANKLIKTDVPQKRKLGILEGKASVTFSEDFSMTAEELVCL